MRYEVIAGVSCGGGNCPTIYADSHEGDTVLVQGYVVTEDEAAGLSAPAGEALVRIPRTLLTEAADHE